MRRILQSAFRSGIVLWVALTLVFFALRVLPGDALSATLLQSGASRQQILAQQSTLCLNCSLPKQYLEYWKQLVQGDLGFSTRYRQPVALILRDQFVSTFTLAMASLGWALLVGLSLGIGASIGSPAVQTICNGLITLAQAIPIYVLAMLGIYIFSVWLAWLPAVGASTLQHLILPAWTLGFHIGGNIARVLSASLGEAYAQPFMLTARAKGLPPIDQFDHAIRVALLPVLAVIALQIGFLLGGTVIIEYLFVRRGVGVLLHEAVVDRDYAVVQALVLIGTLIYLVANSVSHLGQYLLDPRLRD